MSKQVYGKFKRCVSVFKKCSGKNSDDSIFSDEDDPEKLVSDDTTKIGVLDQEVLPQTHKVDQSSDSERNISKQEDFVWDFLDRPSPKRRRIKRVAIEENSETLDDISSQGYNKAVNAVSDILSSMKTNKQVEDVNCYSDEVDEMEENRVQISHRSNKAGQIRYGRTRTILQKQTENTDEDNGNSSDEITDNDIGSDSMVCQNFNQLKEMGGNLKYQDDLDFIMNDVKTLDVNFKCNALLRLCLEMQSSRNFCNFIIKYCHRDVWKWSFKEIDSSKKIDCILQCFIAYRIPLSANDHLWSMLSLDRFIIPLVSEAIETPTIHGSMLLKMNYKDFLKGSPFTIPSEFALHIWDTHMDSIENSNALPVLATILKKNTNNNLNTVLSLIEKNIPVCEMINEADILELNDLFKSIFSFWSDNYDNENTIKCIIKLTNYTQIVKMNQSEMISLFHSSINYIESLNYLMLGNNIEEANVNLVILHLGLCLNYVIDISSEIRTREFLVLMNIFKMLHSKLFKEEFQFMNNLFCLVFAYCISKHNSKLDSSEMDFLRTKLKLFSDQVKSYNYSIFEQISYILNKI